MIKMKQKTSDTLAKERLSFLRKFSKGTMPIDCLVQTQEEYKEYSKIYKKMRQMHNIRIILKEVTEDEPN